MLLPEGPVTSAGGFEFRKSAAFLFQEVVLDPTSAFCGRKDVFPIRCSFTEQNRVSLAGVGRPVFTMKRSNSSWVRLNPCHWIRARLQTGAHIQLQHDRWLRIFRQYFDGTLAPDGCELELMIVIAGL